MLDSISIRRQVEFAETDMAGIVHFSNYLRWVEAAESAFFQALNYPLLEANEQFAQGWPRVRIACDYKAPLAFQDTVEVFLFVKALKIRAIEYGFAIYKVAAENEKILAAKGKMTTVHVRREPPTAPMVTASIPDALLAQIGEYVE